MTTVLKWLFGAVDIALIIVITIVFMRACDARSKPPLEPWHGTLSSEVRAKDLGPAVTLADYIRMEDALFAAQIKAAGWRTHEYRPSLGANHERRESPGTQLREPISLTVDERVVCSSTVELVRPFT